VKGAAAVVAFDLAAVGNVATAITAAAAVWALLYAKGQVKEAKEQLKQARIISAHDFLLRLDEALQRHTKVHLLLQPGFEWGSNKDGPASAEEWFLVTSYMGLFERVNVLVESGIFELPTVDKLYGYRVYNIVANDAIRKAKLENSNFAPYWAEFIKLWLKLKSLHNDWNDYPGITSPARAAAA
jgi:hypothetical protein